MQMFHETNKIIQIVQICWAGGKVKSLENSLFYSLFYHLNGYCPKCGQICNYSLYPLLLQTQWACTMSSLMVCDGTVWSGSSQCRCVHTLWCYLEIQHWELRNTKSSPLSFLSLKLPSLHRRRLGSCSSQDRCCVTSFNNRNTDSLQSCLSVTLWSSTVFKS